MSLEPRIIKGLQAEYLRAEWDGANKSGVRPIGTSVLILMDLCADTSSGAVLLPPELIAKMNNASESGVIAALGEAAFRYYDDGSKWTDYKPQPGDRVFTERYAGREIMGADGRTYRMMTYTCIGGLQGDDAAAIEKKAHAKGWNPETGPTPSVTAAELEESLGLPKGSATRAKKRKTARKKG